MPKSYINCELGKGRYAYGQRFLWNFHIFHPVGWPFSCVLTIVLSSYWPWIPILPLDTIGYHCYIYYGWYVCISREREIEYKMVRYHTNHQYTILLSNHVNSLRPNINIDHGIWMYLGKLSYVTALNSWAMAGDDTSLIEKWIPWGRTGRSHDFFTQMCFPKMGGTPFYHPAITLGYSNGYDNKIHYNFGYFK